MDSNMADTTPSTPSPPKSVTSTSISRRRSSSPSPSVTPSLAIEAVPHLDRSVSTPSSSSIGSYSTLSTRSRQSRLSDGGTTVVRRRGYMRPQGTAFADSARNRDSVMSLGSIAHMQYYFARTGLLDGKGAQLAKERKRTFPLSSSEADSKDRPENSLSSIYDFGVRNLSLPDLNSGRPRYAISDPGLDNCAISDSPHDMTFPGGVSEGGFDVWPDSTDMVMLPPTVSTYKLKPDFIEPLPDMPVLRRELKEALQDACKVLEESQKHVENEQQQRLGSPDKNDDSNREQNNGFYEIQGLHLLDIITLAIRAAKNYYTAHTNPQKLYAIRSERKIRADLYQVLDILKRMASRNFRGGIRMTELTGVVSWIESIDQLLKLEEERESLEVAEREALEWRDGDWTGREREREWLFLKSFDADEPPLPRWPEPPVSAVAPNASDDVPVNPDALPHDFLDALRDGQRLVKLHNAILARSKRRFNEIKTWHTDVARPYRMAENLQFWMKAAELHWDVLLSLPVLDVVGGKSPAADAEFEQALVSWCRAVRTDLTEEWAAEQLSLERKRPPELKIEVSPHEPENAVGKDEQHLHKSALPTPPPEAVDSS